jgi:hypothetical protein
MPMRFCSPAFSFHCLDCRNEFTAFQGKIALQRLPLCLFWLFYLSRKCARRILPLCKMCDIMWRDQRGGGRPIVAVKIGCIIRSGANSDELCWVHFITENLAVDYAENYIPLVFRKSSVIGVRFTHASYALLRISPASLNTGNLTVNDE